MDVTDFGHELRGGGIRQHDSDEHDSDEHDAKTEQPRDSHVQTLKGLRDHELHE